MRPFKRILVAIGDLKHVPGALLRKTAALARASNATIELFHSIETAIPFEPKTGRLSKDGAARIADMALASLERSRRSQPLRDLKVRCSASWDYPAHEAIIRRALAIGADAVIATTERHTRGERLLLLRNTDWELIRHCPIPLLLVKSTRDYAKPVVLAAVDPFHAHAKPANLDPHLLDAAATLARALGGELHVFHAYQPLLNVVSMPSSQPAAVTVAPAIEAAQISEVEERFNALAERVDIPPARRHLRAGDTTTQLTRVVKSVRASIVVMGAVSRSRLQRAFIGSTAERALDEITCDVLIVKPRGFKTPVPKRPVLPEA